MKFGWNNLLKKQVVLLLIIGLILGGICPSTVDFAGTPVVASVSTNDGTIYQNEEFTLQLNLVAPAGGLTYSYVKMGSLTNFAPINGVTTFNLDVANVYKLPMKYIGSSRDLSVIVGYSNGTEVTETISVPGVVIPQAAVQADPPEDTSKKKPLIKIASETIPTFYTGSTATLRIPLENYSGYEAKNVIVSIDTSAPHPFSRDQSEFSAKVSSLTQNSNKYAEFNLSVSKTAESKVYELPLIVRFHNGYGDSFPEITLKYSVRIKNSSANVEPTVGITDYSMKHDSLAAGGSDTLTLRVENKGTAEATDIRVELSGFDKSGIRINKDVETKYFNSLIGRDFTNMTFGIAASGNAKTDTYELQAKISYLDENGKKYERITKIFVPIDGKDSSAMDFTISGVKAPENIVAGDSFSILFDLKNSGVVNGDVVEVSVEYPAKMIPKSSPKRQIKNLAAGKSQKFQFDFKTMADIETNNYDFYISIKYNAKGAKVEDAATIKEYVGIYVNGTSASGRPKIIVQDYDIGKESVQAGVEFPLNLTLRNTSGVEAIKNIKVKITSDEGVFTPVGSSSAFFVERIEKGGVQQKSLKFKVKADAAVKSYNMKIEMEYEDSKGNAYDVQKQAYKEEESISIPVEQPVRLEIGDVNIPPEAYMGQPVAVDLEFYNMGKSTLYNLFVKLEGGFDVQDGSVFIGNFDAGRSEFFSANVTPTQPGVAAGKIIFSFEDSVGNKKTVEKEVKFNVLEGAPVDPNAPIEPGTEGGGILDKVKLFFASLLGKGLIAVLVLGGGGFAGWRILKKRKARKLEAEKALLEDEDDEQ